MNLPTGLNTVRVRAIDTTTEMVCNSEAFVRPVIPGHELLNLKTMCFLIDNEAQNKRILFDCGSRKDYWNGPLVTRRMIGSQVPALQVEKGVDEILVEAGVPLNSLDAIVWSHWHWDHIGDGSKYDSATDIVVGPGFKANFCPGWPEDPNGVLLSSDLEGHVIDEITFEESKLRIGDFRAHDYLGDGSFYILDVPGHAIGHICGFARTTHDTFVFLGGDCCHFPGTFRPTFASPMPEIIPDRQLDESFPRPCPCSLFTTLNPFATNVSQTNEERDARRMPFYKVTRLKDSAYICPEVAENSIRSLEELDADPNIFILLAHDSALFGVLPLLNFAPNEDISDWKSKGYKDNTFWGFLNELPRMGKPGRKKLVSGLMRNGNQMIMDPNDVSFRDIDDTIT
ncbi:metallo-beta-lactamase superfamily protein [Aaosphaeria arxii CBS 175.79]|uniref:Metallo-beta-lactamase superfamily protein n=1 Tax=Aaosphaeria arxii CBS 175.79 TaxID=1450172 RepID=A0A6A5Y813_9PLEO|nr:metallo-beta-lactamase superfamily protein [Aaosphaeria arxii CBS 175.79]KAF2021157.1 metallo-beta-lactamase superfamily protein [Aaosphaeria arxii CBS 175.79]